MTFLEYVNKAEHLIGAFRVGALSESELKRALAEVDLECEHMSWERLSVLFPETEETDNE